MLKFENHCVDCGKSCLGQICPNRRVPTYYCDRCGKEIEKQLYILENNDLCKSCYDKFVKENENDIFEELSDEILKYLEVERVIL